MESQQLITSLKDLNLCSIDFETPRGSVCQINDLKIQQSPKKTHKKNEIQNMQPNELIFDDISKNSSQYLFQQQQTTLVHKDTLSDCEIKETYKKRNSTFDDFIDIAPFQY